MCGATALMPTAANGFSQSADPSSDRASVHVVSCESESGGRQHCTANTESGVVLLRPTGSARCLLGRNWGYDDGGIWVEDGCGGEFGVQALSTAPVSTVDGPASVAAADWAPTYYLQTDAPLYYYSFTDAHIAMAYLGLSEADQDRFDPMITGFNPADMYAVDHIRRVLETYPGVFSGIGEFTIHKEFVSSKVAGEVASLVNPALDRIMEFAGKAGLVVILHNDVNMPFPKPDQEPYMLAQMKALFYRHPETTIIWAHIGLGRVVRPMEEQAAIVEKICTDPDLSHVYLDISWEEVAKYATATPEATARTAAMINRFPERFLFGSDVVAPTSIDPVIAVYEAYAPLWEALTPEAREMVLRDLGHSNEATNGIKDERPSTLKPRHRQQAPWVRPGLIESGRCRER